MSTPPPETAPISRRKLAFAGVIGICVAATVVVTGLMARAKSSADLKTWTNEQAISNVAVAVPEQRPLAATLDLPGRLEANYRAPIFARVSGYLKAWNADIGARVKSGQVIGEIEAPDLDQQLLQARADLASAQSAQRLSEATLARRRSLLASNFVSMQEIDERTADTNNKSAAVKAQQANVDRLEALAGYKSITAPFDGTVTERNTDVGALISGGGATGPALFVVSDVSRLRVYVNVPQTYVPSIRLGAKADIALPEYPNRTFPATVEASSQAVDSASGTTRMQLGLDNAKGELMPGGSATVKLKLEQDKTPLSIPASALIFNKDGLRVAVVGADDRVVLKTIAISRDLGRRIELSAGLTAEDRVITAPPDGLTDGERVRIVGPEKKPASPATASDTQNVKG